MKVHQIVIYTEEVKKQIWKRKQTLLLHIYQWSSTILTVVRRVKQLNRLRIEKQQTWSKPISLSKTWTLTICLRLPYKSRAAAGGDLGPIGDSTNEDLHALSITFFKLAIKRAHNTISFYFYYKGEIMQWPLLSSSIE